MKKGGLAAFLLAGLIMIGYGIYNAKESNEFMDTAMAANATIVKIDVEEKFDKKKYERDQEMGDARANRRLKNRENYIDYSYVAYVEYDVNGNKCSSKVTYPTDSVSVGDIIKVWYNPENTTDIRIEKNAMIAYGLIILGAVVSVLSFISLIVSGFRKKQKN
ncbi:MAG: DUF3592 domain-containing protein [Bacteroidales bacterium]|nr:DUF3592 domain-containing protein [Bacteroidales bacterium]